MKKLEFSKIRYRKDLTNILDVWEKYEKAYPEFGKRADKYSRMVTPVSCDGYRLVQVKTVGRKTTQYRELQDWHI